MIECIPFLPWIISIPILRYLYSLGYFESEKQDPASEQIFVSMLWMLSPLVIIGCIMYLSAISLFSVISTPMKLPTFTTKIKYKE